MLGEALASGAHIEAVYIDAAAAGPAEEALAADILAAGGRVFDLAPGVLGRVADTATPQPILGIVGAVDVPLASLVFDRLVLVCADIRDPGNLGTVLRSAEASGAAGVIVCEGSVDPSNAKAVRASAGAVFHVPLVLGAAPAEVLTTLGARGVRRLGTSSHRGAAHTESHLVGPVAVVLGNEASGLPADLDDLLDGFVTIPHEGRSESLNVGMAAAVIAFEAHRQRAVCEAVAQ